VQKKRGQKAQALNSAELAAFFDHAVLPRTLERRLQAKGIELDSKEFDDLCKEFALSIGIPQLWYLIMYPFAMSTDNCQKHPWLRKLLLRPRLNEEDWQSLEEELQQAEDEYVLDCARVQLLLTIGDVVTELSDEELDELAQVELLDKPQLRAQCLAEFERDNGLPYKMSILRRKMIKCPWLRIVFPHQFMPLTPITPDAHQAIEHRVHEAKHDCSDGAWKLLKDGVDSKVLLLARTYQDLIIESAKKRSSEEGRKAIKQSIRQMLQLLRILRARKDEIAWVFLQRKDPSKKDGSVRWRSEWHWGTAGGWGPASLS
jgi:hypothetical protein